MDQDEARSRNEAGPRRYTAYVPGVWDWIYDGLSWLLGISTFLFVWYLCAEQWGTLGLFMGIIPAFLFGWVIGLFWLAIVLFGPFIYLFAILFARAWGNLSKVFGW